MKIVTTQSQPVSILNAVQLTLALPTTPPQTCTVTPGEFFGAWFERVNYEVNFQPRWLTDDGHFDWALHDQHLHDLLPPGTLARCTDDHGRRVLFVGTDWGPVVVFERYSDEAESLVCQLPAKLKRYGMDFVGYLSLDELHILLGNQHCNNIGQ